MMELREDRASGQRISSRPALAPLSRYWTSGIERIEALPIPVATIAAAFPPRLTAVALPAWIGGEIVVPSDALVSGDGEAWARVDWLGAAEWFITCAAERAYEREHGPIHSYSFRLAGWDPRMWERAWANRIALFLRRWAERVAGRDDLFGPMPDAELVMTHDVDAVSKTLPLRVKQSAFHGFNAAKSAARRDFARAGQKAGAAVRFFARRGDLWNFETITQREERRGIRSHFNFYGGTGGWLRPPKQILIDPGYRVGDGALPAELRRLHAGGWTIGLHQSFGAWRDPSMMRGERERVASASGAPVSVCRQHWLRFSFAETWRAQAEAGFALDTTLGFNDRPSFRNGAAVRWRPLEGSALESLPMVLMDSHFYDYRDMTAEERREDLAKWIGEIRAVRGCATVLWHQQTCSDDYGWTDGFDDLLREVAP